MIRIWKWTLIFRKLIEIVIFSFLSIQFQNNSFVCLVLGCIPKEKPVEPVPTKRKRLSSGKSSFLFLLFDFLLSIICLFSYNRSEFFSWSILSSISSSILDMFAVRSIFLFIILFNKKNYVFSILFHSLTYSHIECFLFLHIWKREQNMFGIVFEYVNRLT